jgi:hypothetical protein
VLFRSCPATADWFEGTFVIGSLYLSVHIDTPLWFELETDTLTKIEGTSHGWTFKLSKSSKKSSSYQLSSRDKSVDLEIYKRASELDPYRSVTGLSPLDRVF